MVNKTKEFKMSKSKVEKAQTKQFLSKKPPTKVIQYIISTVNTCEQKMIKFGKYQRNNNQDKWNNCHHFLLFPLLGVNHCLHILYMYKKLCLSS